MEAAVKLESKIGLIEKTGGKVVIQLKQHVGGPCKAIVSVGDLVERGQLIAVPEGLGANIHSSVKGLVESVEEGSIAIKADEDQPENFIKIKKTDDMAEAIKEAGVVGAGGAGFPTGIKLGTKLAGGYVIANAAECEPILDHNILYLEDNAEVIVRGVKYVKEITEAGHGIIAIKPKPHNKRAIAALEKACAKEKNVEVKLLPDMYPAGDERVIIRELIGVELNPGQLPLEANAVICNVETMKNIVWAIEDRRPVITKDLTVGGRLKDAKNGKVFFNVPIGTDFETLLDASGGYYGHYGEIVAGGPFTGKKGSEETAVTKTTGGILVAMPFPNEKRKVGIIACECGAQEERLRQIAEEMGAEVVAEKKCKRMKEDGRGRYRCELPGSCPGQAETVLYLKKHGAEVILTGTCQD